MSSPNKSLKNAINEARKKTNKIKITNLNTNSKGNSKSENKINTKNIATKTKSTNGVISNDDPKFESRKKDHITQSLNELNQVGVSPSDQVQLHHKAMPEINFKDVNLKTRIFFKTQESIDTSNLNNSIEMTGSPSGFGIELHAPIFVSSMTAGHKDGERINYNLAKACAEKNWLFAVGSQRKQLTDPNRDLEWVQILKDFPRLNTVGNLGLTQLISYGPEKALKLLESLNAKALFIHCNPLQEALQIEGTTDFKNGFSALQKLCDLSPKPIILKETGCGFDRESLNKIFQIKNLYAVDVSGFGGTHWGRIEGHRNINSLLEKSNHKKTKNTNENKISNKDLKSTSKNNKLNSQSDRILEQHFQASQTFKNWGISTAKSLSYCSELSASSKTRIKYWASGGVRSGLDVVTCLTMGAEMVGLAQPILKHVLLGYDSLIHYMDLLEYETKIGLFCTGYADVMSCRKDGQWEWK